MAEKKANLRIREIVEKVVNDRGLRYEDIELVDGKDHDNFAVTFRKLDGTPLTSELGAIDHLTDEEIGEAVVELLVSLDEISN